MWLALILRRNGMRAHERGDHIHGMPPVELRRELVRIRPERVSTWNGGGIDRTFFKPSRWHEVRPGQPLEEAAVQ